MQRLNTVAARRLGAASYRPWLPLRRPCSRSLELRTSCSSGKAPLGNVGKLGKFIDSAWFRSNGTSSMDEDSQPGKRAATLAGVRSLWRELAGSWEQLQGKLLYRYFNWRQSTGQDLQLFMVLNAMLLVLGGWIEGNIVRQMDGSSPEQLDAGAPPWWTDFYNVISWVFGNDLPKVGEAGLPSQVFAVTTVAVGLASFALVLALIEQVVLEVLESNVKRGSQVYEEGHLVVLSWCESAYDLSMLVRILGQVCIANKGRKEKSVVVVLTQDQEKLQMESMFRDAIPLHKRFGTEFVFRQGSPLDPASLHMVAADKARAVIISADSARSALDSDAQSMRAAVLLDEMAEARSPGSLTPTIVFQVSNTHSLDTVDYALSGRVIPVSSFQIQARRIARIVRNPALATITAMLPDFRSNAHLAIHDCPSLVGVRFRDLHAYFPNAIMYGLYNNVTRTCKLNPPPDTLVKPSDSIYMLRSGPYGDCAAAIPLLQPPVVDLGDWEPSLYTFKSRDEEPLGVDISAAGSCASDKPQPRTLSDYYFNKDEYSSGSSAGGDTDDEAPQLPRRAKKKKGVFVLPLQYSSPLMPANDLLILGWGRNSFMWSLLNELDHGPQCLPPGSNVTLCHDHGMPGGFRDTCNMESQGITNLNLRHVRADPRSMLALRERIDITQYKTVIVLADILWANQKEQDSNDVGTQHNYTLSQVEMLRMDAAVLMVQLHCRTLLDEMSLPDISVVVQRMTVVGNTRFEDATRLPLGLPVNPASYIGKVLTQVALDPRWLDPWVKMGEQNDIVVQDSSAFAALGEPLSFLQLQARAAAVRQIIVGWYRIPSCSDRPLDIQVNPQGLDKRSEKVVWNYGDSRCKLVTVIHTSATRKARRFNSTGGSSDAAPLADSSSDHTLSDWDECKGEHKQNRNPPSRKAELPNFPAL